MKDYTIEKLFQNVLVFTITREQVFNAINDNVMDGLHDACERVKKDPSISLLVITASGEKAFCSGGDLQEFHSLHTSDQSFEMLQKMTHQLFNLATLPVPVIALLNGTAVGGGMELAAACDIRFANEKGRFGFIQANLAITTGWGGGTLLFEKFPEHKAMEWLLKADKRNASEWLEDRFFNRLFTKDPLQFLAQECHSIMSHEVDVLRAYKQLFLSKINTERLLERMLGESRNCSILWEKEAHHKAVEAFLQKKVMKDHKKR